MSRLGLGGLGAGSTVVRGGSAAASFKPIYDPATRIISGSGVPAGSTVGFTVNGVDVGVSVTADSNGTWSYTFPAGTVPTNANIGVIVDAPPTPTPSTLQDLGLTPATFPADAATGTVIGSIVGLQNNSTLAIVPTDARVTLGTRSANTQQLKVGTGNSQGTFTIFAQETSSDLLSTKTSAITLTVQAAASGTRTKLTQGQIVTIDNQSFQAQIPDLIASAVTYPALGRTNIIGGVFSEGGGVYDYEAWAGESCSATGDPPRKMRAELSSTRKFTMNEVLDATVDFTIDVNSSFVGTSVSDGGFGYGAFQIHQSDVRYGLVDTNIGATPGAFVTGTPMFACNMNWNKNTSQLDLNVEGETGLGLPTPANPFPNPARILATRANISLGVKHRIRILVEDGHGGAGRIAVWYTDDVVGGGSAVLLGDFSVNTGYQYVDLQANKPWGSTAQSQTQDSRSYLKTGVYMGLSSGSAPPPFNVVAKYKNQGYKIRYLLALPPNGTAGLAYNYQPTLEANPSGSVTWSMTGNSGSGLSINSSTGAITGATPVAGTYQLVITATADGIATSTLPRTVTIVAAANPAPNAPTALTLGASNVAGHDLSWTAPASGTTPQGYNIYARTTIGPGSFSIVATTAAGVVATTINSLSQGVSYDYKVTAFTDGGESSATSNVTGVTGVLKCVATNGQIPNKVGTTAGTKTRIKGRRQYKTCQAAVSTLQVFFDNWYITNTASSAAETNVGNSVTIQKVAAVYNGTVASLTFSSSRSATMGSGASQFATDELTTQSLFGVAAIPAGSAVEIRWMMDVVSTNSFAGTEARELSINEQAFIYDPAVTPTDDVDATGSMSTPSGATVGGVTGGQGLTTNYPKPTGLFGKAQSSFIGVVHLGDSLGDGVGDSGADGSAAMVTSNGFGGGWMRRCAQNHNYAFLNITLSGRALAHYVVNRTKSKAYYPYFTHGVVQLIINDVSPSSVATNTTNRRTAYSDMHAAGIGSIWQSLAGTEVATSTDRWTSLAGQTQSSGFTSGGARDQNNTAIVADVGTNFLNGVIDVRTVTCDATDNTKWAVRPFTSSTASALASGLTATMSLNNSPTVDETLVLDPSGTPLNLTQVKTVTGAGPYTVATYGAFTGGSRTGTVKAAPTIDGVHYAPLVAGLVAADASTNGAKTVYDSFTAP